MIIKPKTLFEILSYEELKKTGLTVPATMATIRRHYCSQMKLNNLCSECLSCADALKGAFENSKKVNPRVAPGLFVVQLRHQVAAELEKLDAKKSTSIATNKFGEKIESTDLFEEFEKALS